MEIDIAKIVDQFIDRETSDDERRKLIEACEVGALIVGGKPMPDIVDMYGKRATTYAAKRWRGLLEGHSPLAQAVVGEVNGKRDNVTITRSKKKEWTHYSMGFEFSREECAMMMNAISSSICFMNNYGRGCKPLDGGFYEPGTHKTEDDERWLPASAAALYCGRHVGYIINAGRYGQIRRRAFVKTGEHNLFEYSVSDLDKLMLNDKGNV